MVKTVMLGKCSKLRETMQNRNRLSTLMCVELSHEECQQKIFDLCSTFSWSGEKMFYGGFCSQAAGQNLASSTSGFGACVIPAVRQ